MSTPFGKKKKKKGGKDGLEWRILHEKEQKQKRHKLIREYLLDKIKREDASARLNAIKLDWKWRKVLRDLKSDELKEETRQMREAFEKLVETKNDIIDLLVEEIAECEKQRRSSFSGHLKRTELVLDVQNQHLRRLNEDYESQVDQLLRTFETEESKVDGIRKESVLEIKNLRQFCLEKDEEMKFNVETEFQSRKYDILNKSCEDEKVLKAGSNSTAENLFGQLNQLMMSDHEESEELRKSLGTMKIKDDTYRKATQQQYFKIKKLQDMVKELKQKLSDMENDELNGFDQYSKLKLELNKRASSDRKNIEQMRSEHETNLLTLAGSSSEIINHLEDKIRQGERVLRWKKLCDLPETDGEELAIIQEVEEDKIEEENAQQAMISFWRQYNQAYFNQCILNRQNQALTFENVKLKELMKQYLTNYATHETGNSTL